MKFNEVNRNPNKRTWKQQTIAMFFEHSTQWTTIKSMINELWLNITMHLTRIEFGFYVTITIPTIVVWNCQVTLIYRSIDDGTVLLIVHDLLRLHSFDRRCSCKCFFLLSFCALFDKMKSKRFTVKILRFFFSMNTKDCYFCYATGKLTDRVCMRVTNIQIIGKVKLIHWFSHISEEEFSVWGLFIVATIIYQVLKW